MILCVQSRAGAGSVNYSNFVVNLPISPLTSVRLCLLCLEALLGAYAFMILFLHPDELTLCFIIMISLS